MGSRATRADVARLRAVHEAYLRLRSLKKAGGSLSPPVGATRARNMLAQGAALGLFADPLPPIGPPEHPDVDRLKSAYRLYRRLGSAEAAGAAMAPRVSGVRVRQLLRVGAALKLFPDPFARPKPGPDADAVRRAVLDAGTIAGAASRLGVPARHLRTEFREVAFAAAKEARDARRRRACIADYQRVAARLGRNPGMSIPALGNNLYQRIWRAWGSAQAFFREAGIKPERMAARGNPRKKQ